MTKRTHLLHVVGARPNFMKLAPVHAALARRGGVTQAIVHTGQHYDTTMSDVFFSQLGLPQPEINLDVRSGTHARQTADILTRFEPVVQERRPDWVVIYGDVNSTVAAALVCAKLQIRTVHVEAGLRSYDRTMPEEVNRLITDQIADLLLTPSTDANANLMREGIAPEKIQFVGNVMIDTLVRLLPQARALWPELAHSFALAPQGFGLVTLHRPANADDPAKLHPILNALADISRNLPLLFPVHPRTRVMMEQFGWPSDSNLKFVTPLGYLEFLALQSQAKVVITDSGGVQEETTYLGVPCLTLRPNTERPVTVDIGTNTLLGNDLDALRGAIAAILAGNGKRGGIPPLWDGRASERVADCLVG